MTLVHLTADVDQVPRDVQPLDVLVLTRYLYIKHKRRSRTNENNEEMIERPGVGSDNTPYLLICKVVGSNVVMHEWVFKKCTGP